MTKLKKEDLSIGMILAEDIYSHTGAVLIGAGTKLDESHMRFIGRADLEFVHIEDAHEKVVDVSNDRGSESNFEGYSKTLPRYNLQERYQNTVSKFKNIYYDFRLGRVPVFQEIEDLVEPLYEAILNDEHITSKMWQIQAYDDYTFDHSVRVSMIAGLLAKWCGYPASVVKDASLSGLLHDIGKCNIPDEILNKPGPLTPEEFKVIKTHATLGYVLIKDIPNINENVMLGVLQHHERMDGSGYPHGIKGKDINTIASIVAVADVYCAMTADRVYKPAFHPFEVASYILEKCYHTLNFSIAKTFLTNIAPFFIGHRVKLTNDLCGEIVMTYKDDPARPLVRVNETYYDLRKHLEIEILQMFDNN
jgi:putative nucleotidyltransferase with HDIG domain